MSARLLIDANLSWRLAVILKDEFTEITHVIHTNLEEASSDSNIWKYARLNSYNIITNDEDFYLLAMDKGFPPKIILLRTGNQSTKYIAGILVKHKTEIIDFLDNEEYGVLEIY
jgi:predicted nuclease of predicted toxin-antitoxin system